MHFVKELIRIYMKNDFYHDNQFNDIKIFITDQNTIKLFRNNKLQIQYHQSYYSIIWLVQNIKNVENCFLQKFNNRAIVLTLINDNNDLCRYTDINTIGNKIYNFENKKGSTYLHKNSFVNNEDLIEINEYRGHILGYIKLDLSQLYQDKTLCQKDYLLQFSAATAIIRYHILFSNKNILKIEFIDINHQYDNMRVNGENKVIFESNEPLKLSESRIDSINIYYKNTKNIDTKILPTPHTCVMIQGANYSDVFLRV